MRMRLSRHRQKIEKSNIDKQLLYVTLGLIIFGLAMIFDASAPDAVRSFGDKFFYVKRQFVWSIVGLILMYILANVNFHFLQKYALHIFSISVFLLILVLVPGLGITALGANRRIDVGPVGIQPAEFAKLALAIFLASSLSKKVSLPRLLAPLLLLLALIIVEPDLGTSVIIAVSGLVVYFGAGGRIVHTALSAGLFLLGAVIFSLTSDYRRRRLLTFLRPENDPLNASYHVKQILIALGSGGLFGLGLGESRQKHLFLPEPATDSIFAIIAEEFGFIGAVLLILVFMFFLWRAFVIASRASDSFAKLLALGIASLFGSQIIINLAAMVALLPLTGIPLPFVSYGGSSLVVSMASVGILLSISREKTL